MNLINLGKCVGEHLERIPVRFCTRDDRLEIGSSLKSYSMYAGIMKLTSEGLCGFKSKSNCVGQSAPESVN
jgi:hypothetical protein